MSVINIYRIPTVFWMNDHLEVIIWPEIDLIWPFKYWNNMFTCKNWKISHSTTENFRFERHWILTVFDIEGSYWLLALNQSEGRFRKPTWVKLWIPCLRCPLSKILLEREFSMRNQIDIAIDLEVFAKNRPLRNSKHHISVSDNL